MAAAQGKARAACIEASGAVESASAMLEEARSKEPHDYVARLLANGNAGDPVDLVAVAQRKCTDANRQLDLARAGEAALAEGITRAENAVSFAAIRLDSALQEALGAAPEIATLFAKWDSAVAQLGDVHRAITAVAGKTRSPVCFGLKPRRLSADSAYGSAEILA